MTTICRNISIQLTESFSEGKMGDVEYTHLMQDGAVTDQIKARSGEIIFGFQYIALRLVQCIRNPDCRRL